MSWHLRSVGSKEAVKAEVDKVEYAPVGLRDAIKACVDQVELAEGCVVIVETNGHTGPSSHLQNGEFKVSSVKLATDPPAG